MRAVAEEAESKPKGELDLPPADLAQRLTDPTPLDRARAARKLAELPPEELTEVIPALKQALSKEKDKMAKAAIKKALAVAKGGG